MDIKEAQNLFYKEIEIFLGPNGFKVLKSRKIAERKTEMGFNQMFFDMNKSFDFTYSNLCKLRIRHNKIQEIKHQIDTFHDKETSTILTNIFTFTKKIEREDIDFEKHGGHLINFEDIASIDKWVTGFTRFMNEAGFAFFDNFKTDADFDKWFNEPILNGTYDFSKGMIWNDSVSGLVAAKLVENPEYENLYGIWHEKLTKVGDTNTLAELERMYVYLKSFSIQ